MTDTQKEAAKKIYNTLTSQRFADFYGEVDICDDAPMSRHICGDKGAPEKDEILQKIVDLFRLTSA